MSHIQIDKIQQGISGCCGYQGTMGPLIPGNNIHNIKGSHDDKMTTLMIHIRNNQHEEKWTDLVNSLEFFNLTNELKSMITHSSNSKQWSKFDTIRLIHGPGYTEQGMYLRDEYQDNYTIAKSTMPRLTLGDFVQGQEEVDDNILIEKPIRYNEPEYLVYHAGKFVDHQVPEIIDQITITIPSIDLPKTTQLLMQLIKLFD